MANRMISTAFWDDTWVQEELSHDEKLLYLYFLTSPLTNIAGIYEIGIRRMCFDTGLPKEKIEQTLERFEQFGKVKFVDNWIIMINWPKHQNVTAESNVRKGIDRVLSEIPDHIFQEVIASGYQYEFIKELERYSNINVDPNKPLDSPSQGTRNTELNLTKHNLTEPNLSDSSCPKSDDSDEPPNVLEEEIKIAEQMAQIIKEFTPTAKVPTSFVKWAEVIDRTIRIDGRTPEQVLWLFRWSQNHDFWNRNIRSPDKLRKHWDRLVAEAKAEHKPKKQTNRLADRLSGTMAALKKLEEENE